MIRRSVLPATLVLLLAACVPPPTSTPAPRPAPAPAPAPSATMTPPPVSVVPQGDLPADWHDRPRTEGDWVYSRNAQGSGALFSSPQGEPLLAVGCLSANRRVMVLRMARPLPGQVQMDVRTETLSRATTLTPAADGTGVAWSLDASDPLLDAMAFSRGHFAVGVTDAPPLYPPSYPEITRVIEDCR